MENVRLCEVCSKTIPQGKRADALYCSDACGSTKRNRTFAKNNPDKVMKQRKKDNGNAPKRIFTRIKSRAKMNNIEFNLELCDIIVPILCPVLLIEIKSEQGGGTNQSGSPSVDRIDPSKGYTKGNVRVISNRANLLKSNAKVWELKAVLKDLERIQCE